jgi:drug/metabolite transporter (DMT)-like permease
VLFAWMLLGQTPRPLQLVGGLLVLAGIDLIRWTSGRSRKPRHFITIR